MRRRVFPVGVTSLAVALAVLALRGSRPPAPVEARVLSAGRASGVLYQTVELDAPAGGLRVVRACRGGGAQHGCDLWLAPAAGGLVGPGDRLGFASALAGGRLSAASLSRLFLGLHPREGEESVAAGRGLPGCPPPGVDGGSLVVVEHSPPSRDALAYRIGLGGGRLVSVERWACKRAGPGATP